MVWEWVAVAGGGAVGALVRFAVTAWAQTHLGASFPWGTLIVNVCGCFLLGALAAFTQLYPSWSPVTARLLGVGFLGALTTFSTFGVETIRAYLEGQPGIAALNVLANLLAGLSAVLLGIGAGRLLARMIGAA